MVKTLLKKFILFVTKDPKRIIKLRWAEKRYKKYMDNYFGHLYPSRVNIKHIIRYKTFFPMWDSCEIEISSFCNRDCIFCPRYMDRSGIRKDKDGRKVNKKLSTQKVLDIIDQLERIGFKGPLRFGRLSEALLDTRYLEFARYARSKGLFLSEPTNGDVLRKNPKLCCELDGLVKHLTIGIYDYKDENEKKELMEWFKQRFKKTEIGFSFPNEICVVRQGSKVYSDILENRSDLKKPCILIDRKLLIRYDGEVSLCCEDDNCTFGLGNVFQQNIDEIWWSKKHLMIRANLSKRDGKLKYRLCRSCYKDMNPLSLI